ncbi:HTH_Tnp_Tc3_2 domain-containing protein [Trichonephila clavipes]|nr:HTH_Tnp_Tc3_2 domain-containing protein [Trichonephila clavipes]
MVQILLHCDLGYLSTTENCLAAGFEPITSNCQEFERGPIIGLKETGWADRRISRNMCLSDATIRRCCQEWVDNGRFQCYDGSGRLKSTSDWEGSLTVRSAVTALDSSLSTFIRATRTRLSTITIHSRLKQNRYAHCHSLLRTVELDCSGSWLDHVLIMLTGAYSV